MSLTAQTQTGAALSVATDRATLLDALATVGLAVTGRPVLPTLAGVLLEASSGDLTVSATDYDTAVTVRLPGATAGAGRLLVEHGELSRLLDALTKGTRKRDADRAPVTISAEDPTAPVLGLGGYTVPLETLPVADYPPLPAVPPSVARVDRAAFTAQAGRVLVAVETGTGALPMLAGVRLDVTDGALTLAGTDRYRLAVARLAAVTGVQAGSFGAVVAGRLLAGLCKRLTGETVRIGLDTTDATGFPRVSFTCGPVTVVTRSATADYPPYATLLPAESSGTVVVDRARLLTDTRRAAAVLAAKAVRGGSVRLSIGPDTVSVAPALAERAEQVSAPAVPAEVDRSGDPVGYLFAPAYLIEALESFTADTVTVHLTAGVSTPVLFTDTRAGLRDRSAFRHLLMPRRSGD